MTAAANADARSPGDDPRVSVRFFTAAMHALGREHGERGVDQATLNTLIRHLGNAETVYRALPLPPLETHGRGTKDQ